MINLETLLLAILAFLTFAGKFTLTEVAFTQVIFPKTSKYHKPHWSNWGTVLVLTILVNLSLTFLVLQTHFSTEVVSLVTLLEGALLSVSTFSQYLQVKKGSERPYECSGNFYSRLITFFLYFSVLGIMIGQVVIQSGTIEQ